MTEADPRTLFVITLRGDRGPHSRAEIAELLRAGEIQGSDRVRNAFGRQLGTAEALVAAPLRRTQPPAEAQPGRRRTGLAVLAIVAIAAAVALIAVLFLDSAGAEPQPPPVPAPPVRPAAVPAPVPVAAEALPRPGPLAGWLSSDVGGAAPAAPVEVRPGGRWWVAGAGADIWGERDQFRLVSRVLEGDGRVTARVHSATGQHGYAKSGVMLRSSAAPTAAFVLLSLSPGGGGELLVRPGDGGNAGSRPARHQGLPRWLRLERTGDRITPTWSADGLSWQPAGEPIDLPGLPAQLLAGVAVCSHEAAMMTTVFSEVSVQPSAR